MNNIECTTETAIEVLSLGRANVYPNRIVLPVAGGGSIGPGSVRKASDYDTYGRSLPIDEDHRSRSKASGYVVVKLVGDGLFTASGVANGSNSCRTYHFTVCGDVVTKIDPNDLDSVMRKMFPAGAAAHDAEIARQAEAERQKAIETELRFSDARAAFDETADIEIDGLTVEMRSPVTDRDESFGTPASVVAYGSEGLGQTLKTRMIGAVAFKIAENVIGIAATPGHLEGETVTTHWYTVNDSTLIKSDEAAVMKARKAAQVAKDPGVEGLPELKGTPRQRSWAEDIRAQFAAKNPGDRRLKSAKTAKYWIDNRSSL